MKSKRNIPNIAIIIIFILVAILAARKSLDIFDYIEKHSTGHEMTSHSETQLSDPPMSFSPLPWKNYQVIVEDNLFRPLGWEKEVIEKDKPRRKSLVEIPPVAVPQERPKPDPSTGSGHAYNLTLTGIAQNGSEWVAILEDPTRNEGHFLHLGEKFKNSLISEISPEHIILAQGNVQAQLSLGENIQYDTNEQILIDSINNSQETSLRAKRSNQIRPRNEVAQASLIERMKARRRKELEDE